MDTRTQMQRHTQNSVCSTNIIKDVQLAKYHPRINNDSQQNFDAAMNYIFMMLGITGANLPSRETRQVMREHMMSPNFNYSNLDLKCAFTLYVQGRLDFTENHYQNLSIFFIEKVMQSYKRYSVTLKNEELRQEPGRPTAAEYHRIMVEGCLFCFEQYKTKHVLFDFGNPTFEYLEKKNILVVTEGKRLAAHDKAKHIMKVESMNKQMAGMAKEPMRLMMEAIENNAHDLVTVKAKKVLLQEFFNDLIETETELTDLLEN